MGTITISNREDVLGKAARVHKLEKGAWVDGGVGASEADIQTYIAECDVAMKSAKPLTPDQISGDFIQKGISAGLPFAAMQRRSMSTDVSETQQKFIDQLGKLGVDADVVKEITLQGVSGWTTADGPWLIDLEAPSKKFFPVLSPLRNKLNRRKGVGTGKRFRRILGISGSRTGGVADLRISMNESVSTNFRGVALNRPQKMAMVTDFVNVSYKLLGISDDLTWTAQFASEGFENLRGLQAVNLLRSHTMGEEKMILGGRSTALGTPTGMTATARAAGTGETALSGVTTNAWVKIAALGQFGISPLSAAVQVAVAGGQVVDVQWNGAGAPGSHGFVVFVGTGVGDPGDAARFKAVWNGSDGSTSAIIQGKDYTGGNVFTLSGALPTTGDVASNHAADSSASADDFDGILTQTAANGLAVARLNGPLTLDAINNHIFYQHWEQFRANVDEAWVNAAESLRITNQVLGASGNPFRITIDPSGQTAIDGGYRVSRLVNKVTGKLVDVTIHPDLQQGNMEFISYTSPYPLSEGNAVWEMWNTQDYIQVDWPVMQMSYDNSTYQFGALVGYAPMLNAALQGIQAAS